MLAKGKVLLRLVFVDWRNLNSNTECTSRKRYHASERLPETKERSTKKLMLEAGKLVIVAGYDCIHIKIPMVTDEAGSSDAALS